MKKKGMIVEIKDKENSFEYSHMNWMKYENGELIINYQDANDEECEEIGEAPEAIIFHPYTYKEDK